MLKRCPSCQARSFGKYEKQRLEHLNVHHSSLQVSTWRFPQLTLPRDSLYCCTNSSIMSTAYTSDLIHTDLSKRYSMFLLAFFKIKFIMDTVVNCTVELASCQLNKDIFNINSFFPTMLPKRKDNTRIKSLTLRPCVKKALLQTGGRDTTMIIESRRGRGINSRV